MSAPRPRRPASLDHFTAQQIPGGLDPQTRSQWAHEFARLLLHQGRAQAADPLILDRLVHLVETEGIDLLAELWAGSPADTLPGVLWQLYLLREWVRHEPAVLSRHFQDGVHATPVPEVVAGAGVGYGPTEMLLLLDAILTGVFAGDLAVALERAAAFCRVIAVGLSVDADRRDHAGPTAIKSAKQLTHTARELLKNTDELEGAALLWRQGVLD